MTKAKFLTVAAASCIVLASTNGNAVATVAAAAFALLTFKFAEINEGR